MRLVNSILNGEEMLFNNNGDSSVGSGTAEMWTSIINPDMSARCIHETIRDRFVFFFGHVACMALFRFFPFCYINKCWP